MATIEIARVGCSTVPTLEFKDILGYKTILYQEINQTQLLTYNKDLGECEHMFARTYTLFLKQRGDIYQFLGVMKVAFYLFTKCLEKKKTTDKGYV